MPKENGGKKPDRTTVACEQCRRRKIRCDGARPQCSYCSARDSPCSYSPSTRQSSTETRFGAITSRLNRIEESLKNITALLAATDNNAIAATKHTEKPETSEIAPRSHKKSDGSRPTSDFNDRLCLLKCHMDSAQDIGTVYTSGVVSSILSNTDIAILSRQLGDPELNSRLLLASNRMWRLQVDITVRMIRTRETLDPDYIDECKAYYTQLPGVEWLHLLLLPEEVDADYGWDGFASSTIINGVNAALVGIGTAMKVSEGKRSAEFIQHQNRAAIQASIGILVSTRFNVPCFAMIRILLLNLWVVNAFSTVPGLPQFLPPIRRMAEAVDLPSATHGRRRALWRLLESMHFSAAIMLSQPPPSGGQAVANKIDEIYTKVYHRVFATAIPVESDVFELDQELESWHDNLPITEGPIMSPMTFAEFATWARRSSMELKYHHMRLAIHSTRAFSPMGFDPAVQDSLQKVRESALDMLRLAHDGHRVTGSCSHVHSVGVTAALSALLYKQLVHPTHSTTAGDLKILRSHLDDYSMKAWPLTDMQSPIKVLWEVLADIMERHHRVTESPDLVEDFLNETGGVFPDEINGRRDSCNVS